MVKIYPWLKWGALAGGCLVGAFGIFLNLFVVSSDQMSYIDMARVYLHGSWWDGINGYWGPLLPALVALAFRIFHPGVAGELPVANGVAWFEYVFFLAAYLFFHGCLVRLLEKRRPEHWSPAKSTTLFLFGFATAFSAAVTVLVQGLVPDLLVATFFLLASGLIARVPAAGATWGTTAGLAVILALGYLSKSVFFVLAFVFVIAFYGAQRGRRGAGARTLAVALLFLALSAVQWLPLSLAKGRFTFGDTGKIAYVLKISDKHYVPDSRLQTSPDGKPLKHPFHILMEDPLIYGFQGPVKGTYPNWYDLSYWMDGLHAPLHPVRQVTVLFLNALLMGNLLIGGIGLDNPQLAPGLSLSLMAFLAVLALTKETRTTLGRVPWPLWLPALAGVGVYALTYFTFRYVFGLFIVLMAVYFAEALASFGPERTRATRRISLILFVLSFVFLTGQFLETLHLDLRHEGWAARFHNPQVDTALALQALGVPPGTAVAEVGDLATVYFPQAAGIRVLARIEEPDRFWSLSDAEKERVYSTLAGAGLEDVIASAPSPNYSLAGWVPIGASDYVLHRLTAPPDSGQR